MESQAFDRTVYHIRHLKYSINNGLIDGRAYCDGRAKILDLYVCAVDTEGQYPAIMLRIHRLLKFSWVLAPHEVFEEKQRIIGQWPQMHHPPRVPAPVPPPLPRVLVPLYPLPCTAGGLSLQQDLVELPPSQGRGSLLYEAIFPGNHMVKEAGTLFLDNMFLPHEKLARGGSTKGGIVYICKHKPCTMVCRLVPVGGTDPPLYKAEVKIHFRQHTNHPDHDDEQVLVRVLGPGGKSTGFKPLSRQVKAFIDEIVRLDPKISPDSIFRQLVSHPIFSNHPFLTDQFRREDTRVKVRNYRDNTKKAEVLAHPASSLTDLHTFENDHILVVPNSLSKPGPPWCDYETFYIQYKAAYDSCHPEKWKSRYQLVTLPSPSGGAFSDVLGRDLNAVELLRVSRSVVFTSLSDLYNMLMWIQTFPFEFRVIHCDGVHGLLECTDQVVVTIATCNVGWRPTQASVTRSPRPFGHVLCPKGETTISAITLWLCLVEAAAALFRMDKVDFNFSTAVIDHSEGLATALRSVGGPDTAIAACYPHVLRLFETLQWVKRYMANVEYALKAKRHVQLLHRSRSQNQFKASFALVMQQWRKDGEGRLADHFTAVYGPLTEWGNWYYCAIGIAGLIPNNNPEETYNRRTKGDECTPGAVALGTPASVFLRREATDLLLRDYSVCSGVEFSYPVGLPRVMIATVALAEPKVDVEKKGLVYWVNHPRLYGNAITDDRIQSYTNIVDHGDISAFSEIQEIETATFQLCRVRVSEEGTALCPDKLRAVCECKPYYLNLQCTGTALVEDMLPRPMPQDPISSSFISGSEAAGGTAIDVEAHNKPGGFALLLSDQLKGYYTTLTYNQLVDVAFSRGLRLGPDLHSLTGRPRNNAIISRLLDARGLCTEFTSHPTNELQSPSAPIHEAGMAKSTATSASAASAVHKAGMAKSTATSASAAARTTSVTSPAVTRSATTAATKSGRPATFAMVATSSGTVAGPPAATKRSRNPSATTAATKTGRSATGPSAASTRRRTRSATSAATKSGRPATRDFVAGPTVSKTRSSTSIDTVLVLETMAKANLANIQPFIKKGKNCKKGRILLSLDICFGDSLVKMPKLNQLALPIRKEPRNWLDDDSDSEDDADRFKRKRQEELAGKAKVERLLLEYDGWSSKLIKLVKTYYRQIGLNQNPCLPTSRVLRPAAMALFPSCTNQRHNVESIRKFLCLWTATNKAETVAHLQEAIQAVKSGISQLGPMTLTRAQFIRAAEGDETANYLYDIVRQASGELTSLSKYYSNAGGDDTRDSINLPSPSTFFESHDLQAMSLRLDAVSFQSGNTIPNIRDRLSKQNRSNNCLGSVSLPNIWLDILVTAYEALLPSLFGLNLFVMEDAAVKRITNFNFSNYDDCIHPSVFELAGARFCDDSDDSSKLLDTHRIEETRQGPWGYDNLFTGFSGHEDVKFEIRSPSTLRSGGEPATRPMARVLYDELLSRPGVESLASLRELLQSDREKANEAYGKKGDLASQLPLASLRRMRPNIKSSEELKKHFGLEHHPSWIIDNDSTAAYADDQIINHFLSLLRELGTGVLSQHLARPKCYYEKTHFMEKLMDIQGTGVLGSQEHEYKYSTGTSDIRRSAPIGGYMQYDFVFFPINLPFHWVLAVVAVRLKEIRLYDSLGSGKELKAYGFGILRYLQELYPAEVKFQQWTVVACACPPQPNLHDCGLFLCFFAYILSCNLPLPDFVITEEKSIHWREKMACLLVERKMPISRVLNRGGLPTSLTMPNVPKVMPPLYNMRGLLNLGNTCYLNASLQMLSTLVGFMSRLKERGGGKLTRSIVSVSQKLANKTDRIPVDPRDVKAAMDEKTDNFVGFEQRDAHEFLGELVEFVRDELKGKDKKTEPEVTSADDDGDAPMGDVPITSHEPDPTDDFCLTVEVCLKCTCCGYSR
jgi:hypothetical protein